MRIYSYILAHVHTYTYVGMTVVLAEPGGLQFTYDFDICIINLFSMDIYFARCTNDNKKSYSHIYLNAYMYVYM